MSDGSSTDDALAALADQALTAARAICAAGDEATWRAANDWLLHFQHTDAAWAVAERLLLREADEIAVYYGALMLQQKVAHEWGAMAPAERQAVQQLLGAYVVRFGSGAHSVLTRLCVGFVATVLQSPDQLAGSVASMVEAFAPHSLAAAVAVLTVTAEEVRRAHVPETHEAALRQEIADSAPLVLQAVHVWLHDEAASAADRRKLLRCYEAWLACGSLSGDVVMQSAVLGDALDALADAELFDAAVELVEVGLALPRRSRFEREIGEIARRVLALLHGLSAQQDPTGAAGTEQTVRRGVAKLVSALLGSLTEVLFDVPFGFDLCTALLAVTSWPMEDALEVTLDTWLDVLRVMRDALPGLDEGAAQLCATLLLELVVVLLERLAWYWRLPCVADRDSFQLLRSNVADLLEACCGVLGDGYFAWMLRCFAELTDRCSGASEAELHEAGLVWQLEGVLFGIRVSADYLNDDDTVDADADPTVPCGLSEVQRTFVVQVVSRLSSLPGHALVSKAAIKLLGAFAKHFARRPELALAATDFVLDGLQRGEVQPAAAVALRSLCSECGHVLAAHIAELTSAVVQSLDALEARQQCLVFEALSHVLGCCPPALASELLARLSAGLLASLAEQVQAPVAGEPDVGAPLALLNALVRYVDSPPMHDDEHPVLGLFGSLYPVLASLLERHAHADAVASPVCFFMSNVFRVCKLSCGPALAPVLDTLAAAYASAPQQCYLNAIETGVALVGTLSDAELAGLCAAIVRGSQGVFASDEALEASPDIVASFFALFGRLASERMDLLSRTSEDGLPACVDFAMRALHSAERRALASALAFLAQVFSSTSVLVDGMFAAVGSELVSMCLLAVAGSVPRQVLNEVFDLLFALHWTRPQATLALVEQALGSSTSFPSVHASAASKDEFVRALARARQKNKLRGQLKRFGFEWRGLQFSLYGAEHSL